MDWLSEHLRHCNMWGFRGYRSCDTNIDAAIQDIAVSHFVCVSYARTYMCTQVAAELQGGGAAGVCRFAVEGEATFCRYISAGCMLTATLACTLVLVAY